MSTPNDGGPAFPCHTNPSPGKLANAPQGMALRDYFAAKALQAFLSMPKTQFAIAEGSISAMDTSRNCYHWAECMLAAREGKEIA